MTNDRRLNLRETAAKDTAQEVGVMTMGGNIVGGVALPSRLIAFYTLSTPPAGWVEYTAARGRFVVGVPSGGTIAGTVGTALTNLQDKTHTHTGPSHTHPQNMGVAGHDNTPGIDVQMEALTSSGSDMLQGSDAGGSWGNRVQTGVQASGTGNTGTAATSSVAPYIQLFTIQKV